MINKVKRISVNAQHIMIITVESHYNELKYSQKVIRLNLSLRFIMTTVRQTIQIKKLLDSGIPMKLATYVHANAIMYDTQTTATTSIATTYRSPLYTSSYLRSIL